MLKKLIPLFALLLVGCGNNKNSESKEGAADEKSDASYKIVYLTAPYKSYIDAVKKDYSNKGKIYDEKLINPLINNYFSKCEYLDLFRYGYSYFIPDTMGIEHAINGINTNKSEIAEAIHKAVNRSNKYLKEDSITFYVQPPNISKSEILNKMGGVTGMTVGGKHILITVDTDVNGWKEGMEYTVAREYLHSYWTTTHHDSTFKWTLLRYLAYEGKADIFAKMIYPTAKAPWTSALDEPKKVELWTKITPRLNTRNFFFIPEVMFGSKDYPLWSGYTLGYKMVEDALKTQPNLTLKEWVALDAEKLLEMSGWK
jgi:uncharacterized protein YjaZ